MKKFLLILFILNGLAFLFATRHAAHAGAGAAGFPHVMQADRLRFGTMEVELFGIRAPLPDMECQAGRVRFKCGEAAAQALSRMIENYAIACQKVSDTQLFPMLTECSMGQTDITRLLLRAGWAIVDMNSCDGYPRCQTYLRDQAFARDNRKGMWVGEVPEALSALASLPAPPENGSPRKNASRNIVAENETGRPLPIQIDLAAEMAAQRQTDTTLLSFLTGY